MGAYLDKPILTKHSEDGEGNEIIYGVSEMQGWRKNMEDAHITLTDLDEGFGMYAVFDGHGGREVAKFCAKYMAHEIKSLKSFKDGSYEKALVEVFHYIDKMLRNSKYSSELVLLRDSKRSDVELNDDIEDGGSEIAEQEKKTMKETMQADVKEKMKAAEEKGSLSKHEALELVMQMMKLRKMEEQETNAASASTEGGEEGNQQQQQNNDGNKGNPIGALYTEAGCTAIVTLLSKTKVYAANAGDSRGILCRDKKAIALSEDHKPLQEGELKRIQNAGGYVTENGRVNGNLNLSRSIGDLKYKIDDARPAADQIITAEPDIRVFDIDVACEFLVLACDGVFDVMSNERLVEFIYGKLCEGVQPVSRIAEMVFDECICENPNQSQGIGGDNMTCLVVLLKPLQYFQNQNIGSHQIDSKSAES